MPRNVAENAGLAIARTTKRRRATVRFYALDGSLCLLIEADSEDDARCLCRDMRLEFIGLCEK